MERDCEQAWTRDGGADVEVYCWLARLKRTGTTRGSGKLNFHILIRSSDGRVRKGSNVSIFDFVLFRRVW